MANLSNNLKFSRFVKDNESLEDLNYATVKKGNIYTETTNSTVAYLPRDVFYNMQVGALITANDKTRYVLSKKELNFSVKLNQPVDWKNLGKGYSFKYYNPIAHMLDNSQNIIGYITRTGLIYLSDDLIDLKTNKIIANESNGIKIVNSDNVGIFVDSTGQVFKGSDESGWEVIESSEDIVGDAHIDGGTF